MVRTSARNPLAVARHCGRLLRGRVRASASGIWRPSRKSMTHKQFASAC
jgi:hypothetical protein